MRGHASKRIAAAGARPWVKSWPPRATNGVPAVITLIILIVIILLLLITFIIIVIIIIIIMIIIDK